MPFEKTIAQALNLIKEQYKHLGRSLVRLRFRLEISETDNFCIFLIDDDNETKIESGYGTTYDRTRYSVGSHYFRIYGSYLVVEAFFEPVLIAFMQSVEVRMNPFSLIYYDLELEYNVFTIVAHNDQGFIDQITHAIHPCDYNIPAKSYAPFCASKPRTCK